ncbi:MAG: transglutaminase N-terminal domain-containing protein [Rhizomicrobium sp.]
MDYDVRHRTTYRYLQSVSYSCHLAHLTPRDTTEQRVAASELKISLAPTRRKDLRDYFGNRAAWFAIDSPHTVLEVMAESRVSVKPPAMRDAEASLPWRRHARNWGIRRTARRATPFSSSSTRR